MTKIKFSEIVLIILYIALSCSGISFVKASSDADSGFSVAGFFLSYKTIVGLTCYCVSFLIYMFVVSKTQISIVIPLLSAINSCIIVAIGFSVFKETLNAGQAIGVALVIIGAFVIGINSRR